MFPPHVTPVVSTSQTSATNAEWTEHSMPDGRLYYYNSKTKESVWEKPEALKTEEKPKESKETAQSEDTDKTVEDKNDDGSESKEESTGK